MDIPINTPVLCNDGPCGTSSYIILDPTNEQITHLVVKENRDPYRERLVPVDSIADSTANEIRLRCSQEELHAMERFIENQFIASDLAHFDADVYMLWPFVAPEAEIINLETENIPAGEMAVRRGANVIATDGRVGKVDEFLVDPASEHITHLVLREGHLWGKKDVTIPVSRIDHMDENNVYLKIDAASVEKLPAISLRRKTSHSER
jgi:sporulation protein YlmC with PRC-barrel domain